MLPSRLANVNGPYSIIRILNNNAMHLGAVKRKHLLSEKKHILTRLTNVSKTS